MSSNGWSKESVIAKIVTEEPAATMAAAQRWVRYFSPGTVIALSGDLGAGKTTFVKGLAEALGAAQAAQVTSPTFTYLQLYEDGRVPFYHFDLYRLNGPADFLNLGFDDFLVDSSAICCIEWPERIVSLLPTPHYHLSMLATKQQERTLTLCQRY